MVWQWVVKGLIGSSVKERVYQTVAEEIRTRADEAREGGERTTERCDVGVVFALGAESGSLEDRLEATVTNRGDGFRICFGQLGTAQVAVATVGVGRPAATRGTEALLAGHRPAVLISAGFAGGLVDGLPREAVLVPERVVDEQGAEHVPTALGEFAEQIAAIDARGGTLVTCDRVVGSAEAKRALAAATGACAIDMETAAVAAACARRDVPWLGVRVVLDAVDDQLPAAVERLARQKSTAGRLGAALGAVMAQPESVKDMWALKERSLVCADRLAAVLARLLDHGAGGEPQTKPR